MAAKNTTTTSSAPTIQWKTLDYGAGSGSPLTLAIRPDAEVPDVINLLNAKMVQLEAMLMATYGEAGESFRVMNVSIQDNFLWGCNELATEIRALFVALTDAQRKQGGAA